MINAHLVWFLEFNGLLSNIQNGLRQGRNTLDHLVRFETFLFADFVDFYTHLTYICICTFFVAFS